MSRTSLGLVLTFAIMLSACADVRPTAPEDATAPQVRAANSGVQPLNADANAHGGGRNDDGDDGWRDRGDNDWRRAFPRDTNRVARFERSDRFGQESASARIGPRGGAVRLGDFEIIVPAGAVSRVTTFSINLPANGRRGLALAEFSPHGVYFPVPVTVILPYEGVHKRGPNIHVMWWSVENDRWIGLPSQRTGDGRIRANTSHLSYWGLELDNGGLTTAGG